MANILNPATLVKAEITEQPGPFRNHFTRFIPPLMAVETSRASTKTIYLQLDRLQLKPTKETVHVSYNNPCCTNYKPSSHHGSIQQHWK